MKKLSLLKLACVLGVCAGATANAQVFNLQNINQGFNNYGGYNVLMFGQGAFPDPNNNIWNGFDNSGTPGSTDSFGGGHADDGMLSGNPGNPYANSTAPYYAPNNGAAATPVLFTPAHFGNVNAGNAYSDGTLSPITIPIITQGGSTGSALDVSERVNPDWIFSEASLVNVKNKGVGTLPGFPLGLCVLSNVPAGTYSLYLYSANFDGTRGASFVVTNTGSAPSNGISVAMNPNAAAGSGPLTTYGLGTNYVVYEDVVPDAHGVIGFTWGAVSNIYSGLTGEGEFNALQLVRATTVPAKASFVQQPFNSTFGGGSTATLFADGRGSPAPTFQWYQITGSPGSLVTNPVSSQTSTTLSLPNFQTGQAGSYFVEAFNSGGTATSAVAVLNISTTPTVASQSPGATTTLVAGQKLTLTVSATGPSVSYNWYSNSVLVGTTSGTATVLNNGTTVDFSATTSSFVFGPFTANCSVSCSVVNSFSPSGVSDTATAVTVIPQLTGAYDTTVLALNPIAYYPLNEASGSNIYNYSPTLGPLLNGTLSQFANCPNLEAEPGPAVLGFGGNNFAIAFGDNNSGGDPTADSSYVGTMNVSGGEAGTGVLIPNTNLDIVGNFTIATWALCPTGVFAANNNQGYFYGQNNNADANGDYFGVSGNNGTVYFGVGGTTHANAGTDYADSKWHLWVGTYNLASKMGSNYIDGVLVAATKLGTPSYAAGGTGTCIGADYTGGYTRNWNGMLCRFAVFTNTLTTAQVAALYNAAGFPPFFSANPPAVVIANAGSALTIGNVASGGSQPVTNSWYFGTPGSGTPIANGGRFTVTSSNLVISPVSAGDAGSYYVAAANTFGTVDSTVSVLKVNSSVNATIFASQSPSFTMTGPGPFSWTFSGTASSVSGASSGTYTLNGITGSGSVVGSINGTPVVTYVVTVKAAPTDPYPVAVLGDHPIAYFRLDEADNGTGDNGVIARDYISAHNGVYQADGIGGDLALGVPGFPYGSPLPANTDTAASFGVLGSGAVDNTPPGPSNNFVGFIPSLDFATTVSNSPTQAGNGEFSVEAWVFAQEGQHNGGIVTKGYGLGDGNTSPGLFEQFSLQGSDVGSTGSRYDFCVHDALGNLASAETGSFYPGYQNPPGTAFTTGPAYWQHLVGVCDQTNGFVRLYVNGLLAATGTITKGAGIMSTPVPVSIGAKQQENEAGNYDGQLQGYVDDVAIYNYALTSNQVQNHYFATGVAPILLIQPTNAIGASGVTNAPQNSSVTLKSLGFGTGPLHYQWYDYNNGGTPIPVTTATEPGETGSTNTNMVLISVSSAAPDTIGTGTFFVTVSNAYGSVNSALVTINPQAGPPVIAVDLSATTYALIHQPAVFSVVVSGSFPQTNGWFYNNGTTTVPLANAGRYTIVGGPNPTLTIANVTAADQGTYQMIATNAYGSAPTTASALVVELEPTFNGNGNGWTLNAGAADTALPSISGNVLQITEDVGGQINSFFFNIPLYVGAFQTTFTYQDVTGGGADGFSFCLQNDPAGVNALGGGGGDIGYGGAETGTPPFITNSVAVGFDIYNGHTEGWEVLTDGTQTFGYVSTAPVNLPGGDLINISLTYDGNAITLVELDPNASTGYTNTMVIGPVSQYLGSNTAYVGFTGATGGVEAQQNISNFTFTPLPMLSASLSGGNVVITWPTGIGGYVLQSSATVNGTYTTAAGTSTVVNGNNQLVVPVTSGGATFYRLFLP